MTKGLAPWIVFGVFVVYLAASVFPVPVRSSNGFNVTEFGRLPVWANGRVQPFDSVARTGLQQISGPVKGPMLNPTAWLLEALARPDAADTRRIFPISNGELLGKLQLQPTTRGTSYYAYNDLGPKAQEIRRQLQRISSVKAADRAPWESDLLMLRNKLVIYERLKNSLEPNSLLQQAAKGKPIAFDFAGELTRYQADLAGALRIAAGRQHGGTDRLDKETETRLRTFASLFQAVSRTGLLAVVPRRSLTASGDQWSNIGTIIVQSSRGHQPPLPVHFIAGMSSAFAQGKPDVFNSNVIRYRHWLAANGFAPELRRAGIELFSNLLLPYVKSVALYLMGLVLLGVWWRTRSATVYRSALMLVLLAFALHTAGLVLAMMLTVKPSMIAFAGWGIGLTALVAEWFFRRAIATAATAATGLTALIAAYCLVPGGAAGLVQNSMHMSLAVAIVATVAVLSMGGESRIARRSAATPQVSLDPI